MVNKWLTGASLLPESSCVIVSRGLGLGPAAATAAPPRPPPLATSLREGDVACQLGPAAPALQHDLALWNFELGPVADADDGRLRAALAEELHQLFLALRIERRRRFVHHDDVRLVQEDAGEGEALLLAARQGLVPGRLLVDALDQMAEADMLEGFGDLLVGDTSRRRSDRSPRGGACRSGCTAAAAGTTACAPV